jgi:hypothetical protein
MGKLVALNTNNEEKKLKTEQPIATTVAQGRRGKLMQTGSASAPVSSPPTVYRTSPVKTTPMTQQNDVMPKNQSRLGKATFSGNRTPGKQQKYSVGKGIAGATMKGINQAAQGIADTLAFAEDVALSPFELVSGQQLGDLSDSGLANKLQRRIRNEGQEIEDKYAANVERGGKAAEIFDKYGALTVAAAPQAVAAVLTSGASLGATPATLAKTAATEMAPSIANTIRNSVFAMGKDPQYWLSFSQVVGSSYEQALDDMEKAGVDNNTSRTKAALYATGNGLMNAAVEVGGGIQTLPEQLKHGSAAWKAWLESAFDEGKEEVVQGILERATQNVAYKKGNPLASMRDENAILNPRTSAEEFLGGAVVGGVLGGGQVGVNAALQSLARFDNSLGESGRKAIRGSYQEGKDTAEHVKDFIPAYNAGVEGKANPNPTNETAYAGYVAGQNDAKAEARKKTFAQESDGGSGLVYDDYVSREMDSATADEINTVAKALGVRVRMADVVRGGTANGVIEGNEIRIAKDAQDPVMQVVGHEWTHRVQELAPEQYTAFRDAKMRASTELDNLIDAGTNFRTAPDGKDGHVHPNAVGDFQYFDTTFKVGNEYYKGTVNIEPVSKGLLLKDITKIENITQDISSSYGQNPKSTFLRDASMDSIRTDGENVNGDYSLEGAENGKKRYSLKEYTDEEKKQHRKDADEYFGHTYKWAETGYILTNGKKLDFSGRHEGGPGGYRTVDHRDIRDALGDDYGGSDYSGSMVQFMSEGNIRISPESGGINLSVMPTKNQLDSLSDFISHNRGEVILDLDTPDGQTVSSTEYPRGTHANKVLSDIKAYFEDGTTPQVSSLAQFLSLKGTENAQEIAALKRENETLRQRVDYWKGQTRRSDGVRTDSKSVEKAAKELTRRYGAEIEGSEIAGDLASLYDYIARGGDETGDLTYTEARSRADAIAQRIAESAIAKDDEVYREYSELRKYLKDTKITLSTEDAAGITDYADFRRGLFGKVNLGKGEHTNVDQVYSELAESYPEFFSETRENNVSDQIARIADVAGELYNVSGYNPFEGYMGQAVSSISNDILDRFFDLPQAKKTFADVQAEKLDAAKAAGRKAAADAKLAGQMAQGRTDAVKLRHTQEALQKARAQQAEKLDALRNRYREKDATRREGQKRRELRAKITRHAKDLSKKLLRPTDTKHIPENMRSAVAAVLNSINQESAYTVDESGKHVYDGSGTPTQRTQAFEALRDQYQDILSGREKDGDDLVIDPSLLGTDGKDGLLGQVIGMKDKRLSELTREELGTMWKTIRAVEKSVSTAGKVLSKSKFETTKQMADAFKTDVSTRRKKLGGNTTISLETPYTFFAHYGETGKSIYRMLRNAQDSQEIMARDIAEKTRKVLGDELGEAGFKDIAGKAIHGDLKGALRDARGSAIGKWEAETHDITVANGGKLTLTTPQIMELYLLSKRKQALGHLLGGGVIQPEIKSAETGRTKVPRGTQQVFLTDGDIERITGKLTDEQKRVADGLQELTATTLAKYGNDASMQAYGYRKFTEKNYWPIKSAKEALHSNLEKDSGNVRSIKNIGMAQQVTPNANNAVELRSVFDTFADHASDMIDYAAWLAPMEDANRFFNFQYRNDAGNKTGVSVKGLLDEKGGKGAQQYWQKLMGDIQNGIVVKDFEPGTDKMGKFVGKFKGASVGANIRVVIQQPTAFFRAAAVLDPKDMAKGMTGGVTKGSGWEKALEHSPIAMRKDVGSFDISSPYTLKDRFYGKEGVTNKLNDLAGAAAGKADAATWGKLWNACEWQVKREKPDVRAGSNEFYSAVNDVFSDMIDQTQVVDGILQRSNIMRGKSTLSQQATAFMGEPIMSLNVLLRSYDNFRYEENPAKRSKALKTLGRAATALVVTNVVNALAQSIVDGLRDDDRDKDYWEKFFSAFTGVEGDEKNALELIGNVVLNGNVGSNMNPVAQIPFAKDVLSLAQGYDVSRPDMEVFSDLINAARVFVDSAGGDGKKTRKEATLTLLAAASKMFGLPVANIKRDLMATLRTIAQASGSLGFQYEVEKFSYNLASSDNRSRFIGILYDALEQGDYATYEHVRRDLMEQMGLDGESIQSSLKTRYNKKVESEANYLFPQKSLDLLGIRGKYAYDSGEDEEEFSAADLNASSYSKYETQKGEAYRAQADKATSSGAFSRLSDEGKDKALGYVESYAEAVALKENSGGKYEITTKWIQNAQEAQKQYRIAPGVFAACKAAASECEMLKDKDGDSIDYSKGLQIMEMLFRSGLNEQQRTAMYEYLDVPKKIRHWNRARVDEQLAIARKKAV